MLAFEFHYLFHWYVQLNQEKNFKSKIPYLIDTFIRVRRDLQQYDLDLFAATTVRSMDIGTPMNRFDAHFFRARSAWILFIAPHLIFDFLVWC